MAVSEPHCLLSFFRFSAKCGDWGTLSFCQHVDGPKFLPGRCFHHAGLCEFSYFLLMRVEIEGEM